MLNDYHGIAVITQAVQHLQQLADILEMQPRGGLIENVQRFPGIALGQLPRQLHPLRLPSGQGRSRLPQADIGQPHVHQRLQLAGDARHWLEERQRVFHRHLQHLVDVLALVAHLQCFAVIALALAHITGHIDIRQEVHLHLGDTIALTGFAASTLHIEAETARFVATRACLLCAGEQLTYRREDAGIGGGVGAGCATNRALIDVYTLVDVLHTRNGAIGGRCQCRRAIELGCRQRV